MEGNQNNIGEDELSSVLENYPLSEPISIKKIDGGLINDTFHVVSESGEKFIAQRLSKIFSFELLNDIKAVTEFLGRSSIVTPQIVDTLGGDPGIVIKERIWRLVTYIPGVCLDIIDTQKALSAASLAARFHSCLNSHKYEFKFKLEGYHDIRATVFNMADVHRSNQNAAYYGRLDPIAAKVISEHEKIGDSLDLLPDRAIHGDLKLSNIRFDPSGEKAVALFDLDTMGMNKIAIDIGDAARSWCVSTGGNKTSFDLDIFEALIEGYFENSDFLTAEEMVSVSSGLKLVTLELCARYITDTYEESYFKYDSNKYSSLPEQNISRAAELIELYEEIIKNEGEITNIIDSKGRRS